MVPLTLDRDTHTHDPTSIYELRRASRRKRLPAPPTLLSRLALNAKRCLWTNQKSANTNIVTTHRTLSVGLVVDTLQCSPDLLQTNLHISSIGQHDLLNLDGIHARDPANGSIRLDWLRILCPPVQPMNQLMLEGMQCSNEFLPLFPGHLFHPHSFFCGAIALSTSIAPLIQEMVSLSSDNGTTHIRDSTGIFQRSLSCRFGPSRDPQKLVRPLIFLP